MTGRIHPARAVACPIGRGGGTCHAAAFTGAIAGKAGAAWPEVLASGAALQKAPEAKSALEPYRPVGVAFAGGDGISHAGNEQVAHIYFGHDSLRGAVAERDVHGRDRGTPAGDAKLYFFLAWRIGLA